jgi:hypothetical protein
MKAGAALVLVKLLHTIVWAFLAGCIIALPLVYRIMREAKLLLARYAGASPARPNCCSPWAG